MVALAKKFSQKINPYSYQALYFNEIPEMTNVYGFLVPLLISPWIWILDGKFSALQICQILTLIIEAMGIILCYAYIKRRTESCLLSLLGAVIFSSCYWRYTASGGAFPDQWGMTLSLILAFVFIIDEEKRNYHPILYAFMTLCLFYIKQYFVFTMFGIVIVLLKRSKKLAGKYITFCMILGIISIVIVQKLFPLYFTESIPLLRGSTNSNSLNYSVQQILELGFEQYAIFTYIIFLAMSMWIGLNSTGKESMIDLGKKGFTKLPYEAIQLISIFFPTIYIAQNHGTYLTYYLQIWIPYLVITGCTAAHYLFKKVANNNSRLTVSILLLTAILSYESVKSLAPYLNSKILTAEEVDNWKEAYSLLDQYSKEGEILVSPLLADYCLNHDIRTSDYGQAEFNIDSNKEIFKSNQLFTKLFPYTEIIINRNIRYYSTINRNIENNHYTCIALTSMGRYWLDDEFILGSGYKLKCEIPLITGQQNWVTRFYVIQ